MQTVNPNKAGLAFGALLGCWHAMWSVIVALGWAQSVVDFVFWMHIMKPVLLIAPFNILTALVLVAVTAAIGYIGGFALAVMWNWLHREAHEVGAEAAGRLRPAAR